MNNKSFDEKITEALIKETDHALKLKEDLWNKIEGEISMPKNKKRKNIFIALTSIAAAIVIMFMVGTETGRAAAAKLKELFAPEKKIVQELEGQKEDTDVTLNESEMDYIIYIDESRYVKESENGKDRIVFREELDSNIPAVYMEIEQIQDKSPEGLAPQIEGELKNSFKTARNEGQVTEPIKGIHLYGRDGDEWNSKVVKYYLVDNEAGGTFLIKQQLFYEAEEGHGVRFDNMLREFKVVKIEK